MQGKFNGLLTGMARVAIACIAAVLASVASPAVPRAAATPAGLGPADLQSAYNFPSAISGSLQTVAVVTAYDDPNAESDLAAYRSQYGLSPCTTDGGCFQKVSQAGGTTYPAASASWSPLTAKSLDVISAVCPNCHILLVEADSAAIDDLAAAEDKAAYLGATAIDNDWAIPESWLGTSETSYDLHFNHPGIAITAPAGNGGYGVRYPAASRYVTAVGGTVLTQDTGNARGWDETAWSSSGSGCSAYESKPSWQTDTGCTMRTLNDTAAAATNLASYDTRSSGNWHVGTGTEFSAAIIAAAYALAGTPVSADHPVSYLYQHPGGTYTNPGTAYPYADGLNSITSGSDGTCTPSYLCTAAAGYNGPAGVGTPATDLVFSPLGGQSGAFFGWNGMCIDDQGDAATSGTPVVDNPCGAGEEFKWTAKPDGTIRIHSTSCLNVTNGATANGSPVSLATCNPASNGQQWVPRANQTLYNPHSGRCLYNVGSTTPGVQLVIQDCSASRLEAWQLPYDYPLVSSPVQAEYGLSCVLSVNGCGGAPPEIVLNSCIDDLHSGTANGNVIDIYTCNGTGAQVISVTSDGALQVLGKCLATQGDGIAAGTLIVLWDCNGNSSEHWIARSDGSLINVRSGMQSCLDDPGGNTANGTQLQLGACTTAYEQQWALP
jgi:hypothetical protein